MVLVFRYLPQDHREIAIFMHVDSLVSSRGVLVGCYPCPGPSALSHRPNRWWANVRLDPTATTAALIRFWLILRMPNPHIQRSPHQSITTTDVIDNDS